MPWIAEFNGEEVVPRQAPRKVDVECTECGGRMRRWRKSSDGTATHFKHIGDMGSSGGGGGGSSKCEPVSESDKHRIWKSMAADAIIDSFGDEVEFAGFNKEKKEKLVQEVGLEAPVSDKDRRIGDVVVNFSERDTQLGEGVIIEVQHEHKSKDNELVTKDYVEQGYSVVWAYADDFSSSRCKLTEVDFRQRAKESVWPSKVPLQSHWSARKSHTRKLCDIQSKRTQAKAEIPLTTWLAQEECCLVVGSVKSKGVKSTSKDSRPVGTSPVVQSESLTAVAFPVKSVKTSDNLIKNMFQSLATEDDEELSFTQLDGDDILEIVNCYIPERVAQRKTPWKQLFSGIYKNEKAVYDIERPPGTFDDVQCQQCGNYMPAKNASEECKNCGTWYDWGWNLATGRVSLDSIPNSVGPFNL